jgi:hypothetical protein
MNETQCREIWKKTNGKGVSAFDLRQNARVIHVTDLR